MSNNDAAKWLEENSMYCAQKKVKMHPKQCEVESAKHLTYLKSDCLGCARYVKPSKELLSKKRVGFGRVSFGKGKSIQRTPSK